MSTIFPQKLHMFNHGAFLQAAFIKHPCVNPLTIKFLNLKALITRMRKMLNFSLATYKKAKLMEAER